MSVIICDEIRTEINSKEFFIGVYSSDIVIHKVPTKILLTMHVLFEITGSGVFPFEIQVKTLDKSTTVTTEGKIELLKAMRRHQQLGITLPKFPAIFSGETELVVKFRQRKEDRWKVIKKVDVIYRPKEAATSDVQTAPSVSNEQERPS